MEQEQAAAAQFKGLDQDIQDLKKVVLDLNRDLFLLEEELLFPANTQVAVFVSMDVGDFFDLDSVTVKLNDKEVANYLYTEREVEWRPGDLLVLYSDGLTEARSGEDGEYGIERIATVLSDYHVQCPRDLALCRWRQATFDESTKKARFAVPCDGCTFSRAAIVP